MWPVECLNVFFGALSAVRKKNMVTFDFGMNCGFKLGFSSSFSCPSIIQHCILKCLCVYLSWKFPLSTRPSVYLYA